MLWLRDELHLYPTLATLVLVWSACTACQVAVRLLWLGAVQRQHKMDSFKEGAAKIRSAWPWAVCDDGSMPLWCWLPMRAGLHRAWLWKRITRRSMAATIVVAAAVTVANSALLNLRTGSWFEQPYEWYSLQSTGSRVFGGSVELPSSILEMCMATKVDNVESELKTVDQVISRLGDETVATVVYVVPYGPSGVIEVTEAQATAKVNSNQATTVRSVLRDTSKQLGDHNEQYTRVTPLDALTMLPYVWNSILSAGFSDKVHVASAFDRRIEGAGLEYRLIRSQQELESLVPGSNVLTVVQGMQDVLRLADVLPVESKIGYVALSKEDCNNVDASRYISHQAIKFGMFPYGDCSIVDNDRFSVLPLGPSFEHGFPTNTHKTNIPMVSERKQLLNLMVSWTVEKPTRIQAMMAALDVCDSASGIGLGCIIEHNDLAFKILQKVDTALGLNLRWLLSSAPDAYVENLKQSIFTLCPFGKNPEQYRIWEGLAAGSIPIIEDMPSGDTDFLPGNFHHPSYPSTWKCRPDADIHRFLKHHQGPVIFVTDWKRDLPRVIQHYMVDHPEELLELQTRAKQWYLDAGEHLQAELITKSLRFFTSA